MSSSKIDISQIHAYAALILRDAGEEIDEKNITKIFNSVGINVESYWPRVYANALKNVDFDAVLSSTTSAPVTDMPVVSASAGSQNEEKAQPEKKKEEEEEEGDFGFSLFD